MRARQTKFTPNHISLISPAAEAEVAYNCMLKYYGLLLCGLHPVFIVQDGDEQVRIHIAVAFELIRAGRIVAVGGDGQVRRYLAARR